jgi:8-oxo-dGTP pyrophosphatase MutT (NUDIX family)
MAKKTPKRAGTRRRSRREVSAGGVVIRRVGQRVEYLLVEDAYGRWALPKGKVESGESSEQTALREVREETGLAELSIRAALPAVEYVYTDPGGTLVFKTVHFYLIETSADDPLDPDPNEVGDARWFDARAMLEHFGYQDSLETLGRAIELAGDIATR